MPCGPACAWRSRLKRAADLRDANRSINNLDGAKQRRNSRIGNNKNGDDAWKKDFTKWVPIKIFKTSMPESKQKAC